MDFLISASPQTSSVVASRRNNMEYMISENFMGACFKEIGKGRDNEERRFFGEIEG